MQTQALAVDQTALIQLQRLAAEVDRPGNSVFETHDADLEGKNLARQRSKFLQQLATTEQQIKSSRTAVDFVQIRENFVKMQQGTDDLVAEADQVLSNYQEGNLAEASRHMAKMDFHYAMLSETLYRSIEWIGKINQDNLARQFRQAEDLRTIELAISAFMMLLLMGKATYGYQLSRRLKKNMLEHQRRGNYLRTVVDNAVDAMITTNDKYLINSFNPAAERLFGYSNHEVMSKSIDMILSGSSLPLVAQHGEAQPISRNTITHGSGDEVIGKRKDGSTFPVELSVGEFLSTSKKREFVATLRDISERRQNEQKMRDYASQLEHARDEAQRAARLKSEFLANMSHEIRTPMTAVIGYADLLLDPQTTETERITHVQTIRRNGEHLLELINDILDLSKVDAGQMTMEILPCSPSGLIVDIVSLMRVRAKEKNLDFEVEYLSPIPETIHSDPLRLRQILMNLVGNAIKFTPKGQVRILARCDHADSARPRLAIEIADTGIGLTRGQMAKLFQPFVQADSSTTRQFGGSGLGLAICHRFAALLGGEITVESLPGRGSSFTLTIDTGDLKGVRMIEGLREACMADAKGPMQEELPSMNRLACSVLLAEDGFDNQILISTVLRKAGAAVTIAENGRIAVDKILAAVDSQAAFDVVLMDMQMPELDGYGATAMLRQRGYQGAIIALTAHAMAGDEGRCLTAGCTDYLTKPIDRLRLVATVAKHTALVRAGCTRQDSRAAAPEGEAPLISEFASDCDMVDIITDFVASLPARATALREALDIGQTETVMQQAHQLKGAAGGFGFGIITDSAAQLELACQQRKDVTELKAHIVELATLCRRASAPRSASPRENL